MDKNRFGSIVALTLAVFLVGLAIESRAQSLLDTFKSIGEAASKLNREAVLSSDFFLIGGPFAKAAGPIFDGDWRGTFQCSSAVGGGAAFSRQVLATVRDGDISIELGREGTVSHIRLDGRLTAEGAALLRGVVYDADVSTLLGAELRGSTTNRQYEAHGRLSDVRLGQVRACVIALSVTTFAEIEQARKNEEAERIAKETKERARAEAETKAREIAEAEEREKKIREENERAAIVERDNAERERTRRALSEEQARRERAEAIARKTEEARKVEEERNKATIEENRKRREIAEAEVLRIRQEQDRSMALAKQKTEESSVELAFWDSIKTSQNPADYKAYIETFPTGRFIALAKVRANPAPNNAPSPAQHATPATQPDKADQVSAYFAEMRKEPRVALLIGNSKYQNLPKLNNPTNDVRAMAKSLSRLNFRVLVHENLTMESMADALDDFGAQIKSGGVAVFYFAGHGVQVRGANYLMPVEANPKSEIDVRARSIDSTIVLEHFAEARTRVNLMVLDACRDNPLKVANRNLTRGLAVTGRAPPATLIAYSTSPDNVAQDGNSENSVFAAELLRQLESPGLTAEEVFKRVSVGVRRVTNGAQVPWTTGSLDGDFYFRLPTN